MPRPTTIFMKMWSVRRKMAKLKTQDHIQIAGCPVSVAEQALILIYLGGLKNPLDPKQTIPYMSAYLSLAHAHGVLKASRYQL